MFYLKEMSSEDEIKFVEFEKRYKKECGSEVIPFGLNKDNLSYKEFYKKIEALQKIETCPSGFVPAKYFLIMRDEDIVGTINLRYMDNDFILNYAGHIGYGIAPWERNKGYAKYALKQILIIAKEMKLNKVLLTTDENNVASQRVILSCGGEYRESKNSKRFYWIKLGNYSIEESAMAIVLCEDEILTTWELIYGKEVLSCPKGHIEKDETVIDAAIRECFEETNVEIRKEEYIGTATPFTVKFMDHHHKLIQKTIYPLLFKIKNKGNPLAKEERVLSVQFMHIHEFLKQCSYENVRQMVAECLNVN